MFGPFRRGHHPSCNLGWPGCGESPPSDPEKPSPVGCPRSWEPPLLWGLADSGSPARDTGGLGVAPTRDHPVLLSPRLTLCSHPQGRSSPCTPTPDCPDTCCTPNLGCTRYLLHAHPGLHPVSGPHPILCRPRSPASPAPPCPSPSPHPGLRARDAMGSGSSRSFGAQRRRGPHSPAAPERGPAAATTATTADAALAPATTAPPDGRAEALRLLDLLLAESAAWGARAPAGSAPEVAPGPQTEDAPEHSGVSEAPGESPKPTRQSSISYDRAEEELMASIEREYGC
ncbi:PREDICTED: cystin-1 [Chinchilla lanigera]|uniref:cystin-1 n=1 Tax=Chinchilla lanigera TaxID=34839 RepID=UPI0006975E96|nr:PREDICTED: cystin-1 [Chinchilla lanigera]